MSDVISGSIDMQVALVAQHELRFYRGGGVCY